MWLLSHWIPVSKELLYGIGFLLFLLVVVGVVLIARRGRKREDDFPANRIFRGKNLERVAGNGRKDLDYSNMPIVGLKWQQKGDAISNYEDPIYDDDDDEDKVDDGYKDLTVVEKTIQEKAKQLNFAPQKPSSPAFSQKDDVKKTKTAPVKKDATGDKMDFFTTGKSAL